MKSITFRSIEDIKILLGQEVAISEWMVIEQKTIQAFADVTNDQQWIHTDVKRAEIESIYGTTIAHGYLTLSLIPSFLHSCIDYPFAKTSINYGLNKVRFPNPVKVNSLIRGRFSPQKIETIEGGAQIEWLITIEIENQEKPACVANMLIRLYL
jgi:acyl dehydratase